MIGVQSTSFNHCLLSNQKLNTNAVLNTATNTTNSLNQETSYSDQSDASENQVESITVSRTPPWHRNSILNHQQQLNIAASNVEKTNISNNRVPPLPQQHIIQSQPPWQEETQKRRNNSKKRPNFKEDPTGYLGKIKKKNFVADMLIKISFNSHFFLSILYRSSNSYSS